MDEAGGQQDATTEAEQDRSDGPLPEVPLAVQVRCRQVHVGAQLEGQEAEYEGDATEQRQRVRAGPAETPHGARGARAARAGTR